MTDAISQEEEDKGPTIPTLGQFKDFLDRQARILMHKNEQARNERPKNNQPTRSRDSSRDSHRDQRPKGQNYSGTIPKVKPNTYNNQSRPKLPLCRMCGDDHGLFKCKEFLNLSFEDKLGYVERHHLCKVCFHRHDKGQCSVEQRPCYRCPGHPLHNTLICPSREADKRTTMMSVVGNSPTPIAFPKGQKRHGDRSGD